MISRIEIGDFKSFDDLRLPLSPLTGLLGANASGKSNFIEALRFLQTCVQSGATVAVNRLGGAAEVRHKMLRERGRKLLTHLAVTIESPDPKRPVWEKVGPPENTESIYQVRYEIELRLRGAEGEPVIEKEILEYKYRAKSEPDDSSSARLSKQALIRDEQKVIVAAPLLERNGARDSSENATYDVPDENRAFPAVAAGFLSLPCVLFVQYVRNFSFLNISPYIARQASVETDNVELGPAGENLALLLRKLSEKGQHKAHDRLLAAIAQLVPGFQAYKTRPMADGATIFQVKEASLPSLLNPSAVSDGTIRLLCYYAKALYRGPKPSLICIEEPENGLHPDACELLISLFREVAEEGTQVIFATHSPLVVNQLQPDEVYMMDKAHGVTSVKRASEKPDIEAFLKHFELGQLWVQGELWGTPGAEP